MPKANLSVETVDETTIEVRLEQENADPKIQHFYFADADAAQAGMHRAFEYALKLQREQKTA